MSATQKVLDDIQDETRSVLRKYLLPDTRAALVDFPSHRNAGDSLIYLGQQRYLSELGVGIDYICDGFRYSANALRDRVPVGPILIQGGGNLGDRWLETQEFRERVIRDFPDRRIIQLPQSIDFRTRRGAERARRIFEDHSDLTLLIRDHESLERTRGIFPNVASEFCPDLALGNDAMEVERTREAAVDFVLLLRKDTERAEDLHYERRSEFSYLQQDWGLPRAALLRWRLLQGPGWAARVFPSLKSLAYPMLVWSYEQQARINVKQACQDLGQGRAVITDRLHAAVLAALLMKPVIAMDNANGKISAAFTAYLHRLPGARFVSSIEESRVVADQILKG
ncbi:polysaccharide pyruvyl transferase family protein [Pseudonocardia sp. Cha107L01]|uniref:polysaccharide pyruvyl transferase family protein n=1 Tax=Pseudonocardia sp. Cha107L01 TaxID=3457576 RepID=UPI00403E72D9